MGLSWSLSATAGVPAPRRRAPGAVSFAPAPECKSATAGFPALTLPQAFDPVPDAAGRRARARCRIVEQVVAEMVGLIGERPQMRRDRRRMLTHIRQIAMYVCHVVLQVSLTDIGAVFGRDRTTVSYSCHVVEDRRDDPDFDDFISVIERVLTLVLDAAGEADA